MVKGAKEARWNCKYLAVVEVPATKIEKGALREASTSITTIMSSLKSVYENSNFYKEARIVSFLDHMYEGLLAKMKREINVNRAAASHRAAEDFSVAVEAARAITSKFAEGFFLRSVMADRETQESSAGEASLATKSSAHSLGRSQVDSRERSPAGAAAGVFSFGRTESGGGGALDFLGFARPGTSYGRTMYSSTTSSWASSSSVIKPQELVRDKMDKVRPVQTQMWVQRAERVLEQVAHTNKVIDAVEYIGDVCQKYMERM